MHVERNPPLNADVVEALVSLWTEVVNGGGAVGFLSPVTSTEIRPVAERAFDRVREGRDDLAVAVDGGQPVAFGFLATNEGQLYRHWGVIRRLQRHPRRRGERVGAAVLAELEAAGRDRGLERIVLSVRDGTGRERFYLAHGYELEARLPRRLRLAPDDVRDELIMGKALARPDVAPTPVLQVQRLDPGLPLPSYAHPDDAGLDLYARSEVELAPGERAVVDTGLAVAIPPGHVGLVHPRSGLAARHGVGIVNAPGTIDAGYRGEVRVVLVNLDPRQAVVLERGARIAQLLVQRVETLPVVEVAQLPPSVRGAGGFGSSGR